MGCAWKALAFAAFLPFTLRTRLRIEALLVFMTLSVASIIIVGGIKTLAGGGGYGELNLMVTDNTGLHEGSIISAVAIAVIPIILWLARWGTIFPPDRRVRLFAAALIFACLLMPIGTSARTGLLCVALLAVLWLRAVKRRLLYVAGLALAAAIAVPLLPQSYTERMRWRHRDGDERWAGKLAEALQHAHIIYLGGGAFVGIALNPFVYMFVGAQIGLDTYLARRREGRTTLDFRGLPAAV